MKKLIILAVLALFACQGEQGPIGPTGPSGDDTKISSLAQIVGKWNKTSPNSAVWYFYYDNTFIYDHEQYDPEKGIYEFYQNEGYIKFESNSSWQFIYIENDTLYYGVSKYVKK